MFSDDFLETQIETDEAGMDREEREEWDFLVSQFEKLGDEFLNAYGGIDAVAFETSTLPHPSWVLPLHLRRLLPISDDGWFHSPDMPVPQRLDRRFGWELQHSLRRARAATDGLDRDDLERCPTILILHHGGGRPLPLDRPRHVVTLLGEHRDEMAALVGGIARRAASRASVGRSEAMIKLAIRRTEFTIQVLDSGDPYALPGHVLSPYHDDEWFLPEEEQWREEHFMYYQTMEDKRRLLIWKLEMLKRWRKVEKAKVARIKTAWERDSKMEDGLTFGLNRFTAYIRPKEIKTAERLYQEAIDELPLGDPNHYDAVACVGHWYWLMLYMCGATWRDLLDIYHKGKKDLRRRGINPPKAPQRPDANDFRSEEEFAEAREAYRLKNLRWARLPLMQAGRIALRHAPDATSQIRDNRRLSGN